MLKIGNVELQDWESQISNSSQEIIHIRYAKDYLYSAVLLKPNYPQLNESFWSIDFLGNLSYLDKLYDQYIEYIDKYCDDETYEDTIEEVKIIIDTFLLKMSKIISFK